MYDNRVVIIDTGVNVSLLNENQIAGIYKMSKGEVKRTPKYQCVPELTHGTICSAVLCCFAKQCELHCIEVLNNSSRQGKLEHLLTALDWCMEENIKLIHLSIGTTCFNDFKAIKSKIDQVIAGGSIVVATCHNNNKLTYPAALTNVIGVKANPFLKNKEYLYHENSVDGIDISASLNCTAQELFQNKLDVLGYDSEFIITRCNSYTTPFITAKIYDLIKNGENNIDEIKGILKKQSVKKAPAFIKMPIENEMKALKIKVPNIVIYTKEMKSQVKMVKEFIKCFRNDQFNCIALMENIENNNIEAGIFKIDNNLNGDLMNLEQKLSYLYTITDPDCMITVINNEQELHLLTKSGLVDIILTDMDMDMVEKVIKVNKNRFSIIRLYRQCKSILLKE